MIKKKKEVNNFERSSLNYCKEISGYEPLSKEEELELFKDYKYNHSLDSRNKLVNANLKFVMNIAKNYYGHGLSYADLISEGNMGLIKAIDEKFDESKDCKIITYSVWWIKQTIQEAIKKRNGIEYDELPIDTEPRSLMDDEDTQIIIGDEFSDKSIESEINKNDIKESITVMMSSLTSREKDIIAKYYGLDGKDGRTLEEIGKELSLTKERVRQIKDKAEKKMRSSALLNSITADIYI